MRDCMKFRQSPPHHLASARINGVKNYFFLTWFQKGRVESPPDKAVGLSLVISGEIANVNDSEAV